MTPSRKLMTNDIKTDKILNEAVIYEKKRENIILQSLRRQLWISLKQL